MSAQLQTSAPKGRKKIAQGKDAAPAADAALGNESENTSSPEGAKEKGWPIVPLGEIAEVKLGKMLDKAKHQTGRRMPYLRNVNVRWGSIETDDLLEMHFEDDELERFGLKSGDVLVCEGGEPGRAAVWSGHLPDLKYQKALHRVRFKAAFDARLLVYLLELLAKTGGLERRFTGSTIRHFTREAFVQLPIPFPPEKEQRRIVAEIEKQFTRLEAGVSALRRVQANLKRYRAAVLKAACEGKLVPTEAELVGRVPPRGGDIVGRVPPHGERATGNGNAASGDAAYNDATFETGEALLRRIPAERRKNWNGKGKYKEPIAPDTTKLPPLPSGWVWASLDGLAEIKGGITKDQNRKHTAPARQVPYLRVANVQRGFLDLAEIKEIIATNEEIAELRLEQGDILFNEGGDRDKLGRGWVWNSELPECIHQNHVFRARLFETAMNPKFVSWYANTFGQKFFFDEGKHTTNLASISMTKLKALPVPVPPLAEQKRIVAEVERRLSVVEELEALVSANLQRAIRLRQSVLQKAFTGELV